MRVQLQNVEKRYGAHTIFKDISASFEPGHVYPIIGQNGSGKSTLLQIISGFVSPNRGSVDYLMGEANLPVEDWFRHVAMAAPYMDLFEEFTVAESVQIHRKFKALVKPTALLLEEIQLSSHQEKPLHQLSSGMKQRLKLALAIYSDNEVLLLDEPCSNLDKQWMLWYNKALSERRSDRIVVIASNEHPEELKLADQEAIRLKN